MEAPSMSCIRSFLTPASSPTVITFAPSHASCYSRVAWKAGMWRAGIRTVVPCLRPLTGRAGAVRCLASARRGRGAGKMKKSEAKSSVEDDAFYVVRKGDVIGVFKNFNDCQAQLSLSVCDPPVSVYKGYSLQKETEEYLAARGLKNVFYSINAADCKEDLFGTLIPCPFQEPDTHASSSEKVRHAVSCSKGSKEMEKVDALLSNKHPSRNVKASQNILSSKRLKEEELSESPFNPMDVSAKPTKQPRSPATFAMALNHSCILKFDGASKGNPGKAGAGVVVCSEDGTIVSRLRQGLGVVTNNVAEYRGLILGLKFALRTGFKKVLVQGDSNLVVQQVQDLWKTHQQNLAELCKEAKQLKDKFQYFNIYHVKREFNSDADAEANLAAALQDGEVYEEIC